MSDSGKSFKQEAANLIKKVAEGATKVAVVSAYGAAFFAATGYSIALCFPPHSGANAAHWAKVGAEIAAILFADVAAFGVLAPGQPTLRPRDHNDTLQL